MLSTCFLNTRTHTLSLSIHFLVSLHHLRVVPYDDEFHRGTCLHAGIKEATRLHPNPLLFLVDVDVLFTRDMLRFCQGLSVKNESVYFPITFRCKPRPYMETHTHSLSLDLSLSTSLDLSRPLSTSLDLWENTISFHLPYTHS